MKMRQLILGYLENNCYIINSKDEKTLYIIDAPAEANNIIECIDNNFENYEKVVLLLTHAHADHIGAIKEVVEHFCITEIMLDQNELELYNSPNNCIPPWLPAQNDLPKTMEYTNNDDFKLIRTPGHTLGGVCIYFEKQKMIFTGDTLFQRSVGRTDLPGGNSQTLTNSIRENLFALPDDVVVYPGHGGKTSIGDEKKYNPYV